MGIGYMALWGFGAKCGSGVGEWMGDIEVEVKGELGNKGMGYMMGVFSQQNKKKKKL